MKKVGFVLFLIVAIQLVRPDKNNSESQMNKMEVTSEIDAILAVSCYDCHSNKTQYPWYNSIAPISWIIANHVTEGKEHLNFSEWKIYNEEQQNHILKEIEEVLNENEMPLKSYLLLHSDAKLSTENKEKLLNWVHDQKLNSRQDE